MNMMAILAILPMLAHSAPRENFVHIKACKVTLAPDWIIANHVPNGGEISFVLVLLTDSTGQPRPDKSALLYGFCDVSTHAGLTKKQLITATHKGKAVRQIGDWELSYSLEAKRTGCGVVIDAFRYVENRKAYLWVRRGREVKDADYTPTEADYGEFAPYLERIATDRTP